MVARLILLHHSRLSSNDTRRRRNKIRGARLLDAAAYRSGLPNLRFDPRQAEQNDVADDLQAARADLIERVLFRMPVFVPFGRASVLEVDDVDGGDART